MGGVVAQLRARCYLGERDITIPVGSPCSVVVAPRAALAATLIAFPSFASLAEQKPDDPERSQRVYPPGADQELRDEPDDDDGGEPTASNGLDRIRPKGPAAECACEWQLAARKDVHDRYGNDADDQTRQ